MSETREPGISNANRTISARSLSWSSPPPCHLKLRRLPQRLVDDAVAFGQADERRQLLVAGVGLQIEVEGDALETDRDIRRDAQCAAKVELALGPHRAVAYIHANRRRDREQRDARTGHQRLQQHIARTGEQATP